MNPNTMQLNQARMNELRREAMMVRLAYQVQPAERAWLRAVLFGPLGRRLVRAGYALLQASGNSDTRHAEPARIQHHAA